MKSEKHLSQLKMIRVNYLSKAHYRIVSRKLVYINKNVQKSKQIMLRDIFREHEE